MNLVKIGGSLINPEHVARVEKFGTGDREFRIRFSNGEIMNVDAGSLDEIERRLQGGHFPATPRPLPGPGADHAG